MTIGLIGLGAMGQPMARRLLAAGRRVAVASRSRGPVDAAVAVGAVDGGGHAGVVAQSDVTIICVPFAPDVADVLDAIAPALGPGRTIIDCSTISPDDERAFHRRVAATGAAYLEAPLSGGPEAAAEGTLAVVVGGDPAVLARVRPALEPFSRIVVHMGGPGAGQTAKLCNNLIHAAQNLAVAEAFGIARKAGLDPRALREAIMHSTGDCTAVRNRVPAPGAAPQSPANRDWRGFPIDMMIKEMDMVIALARSCDAALVSTPVYRELLGIATGLGLGAEDFCAVGKLFQEPLLGTARARIEASLAAAAAAAAGGSSRNGADA